MMFNLFHLYSYIDMSVWHKALKQWNSDKDTWCIPRRDTPEYREVKKIMEKMKGKKDNLLKPMKETVPKKQNIKKDRLLKLVEDIEEDEKPSQKKKTPVKNTPEKTLQKQEEQCDRLNKNQIRQSIKMLLYLTDKDNYKFEKNKLESINGRIADIKSSLKASIKNYPLCLKEKEFKDGVEALLFVKNDPNVRNLWKGIYNKINFDGIDELITDIPL